MVLFMMIIMNFQNISIFDLESKKTRIIVFDTMDMRKPFDANGTVTETVNRLPRFWYTNEQLDWLCRRALCVPDDWDYIIISHMESVSSINKTVSQNDFNSKIYLCEVFQSVGISM